jgi:hypothetical protein
MSRNDTTVQMPDSTLAVTFDSESYAGAPVWLHPQGAPYYEGEVIGTLGGMVGHGEYAILGTPQGWESHIPAKDQRGSFIERMPRSEAAIKLAGMHLDGVRPA